MKYLVITSIIWAFSFSLIKTYLVGLPSYLVSSIRLFLSLLIFLPFFKLRILQDKKQLLKLFILGIIQYGVMYIAYIHSYKYLKAYEVALFTIFTPIFIVVFEQFIKKDFNIYSFLPPILAVLGTGIIVFHRIETKSFWYGFFLIQIANLSFAFGQIFYKKIKSQYRGKDRELFFPIYLGAFILTLVPVLTIGNAQSLMNISILQWQVLLYLGIIPSGLGFFMWNKGSTLVLAKTLAVMNNIKIPLAILVSILIFKEKTNLIKLVIGLSIMLYALKISYQRENK